jgi:hypothetical protein
LPLIDIQERARGPELIGGNHELAGSNAMCIEYIYTMLTAVSSINLNAQDIIDQQRSLTRYSSKYVYEDWKVPYKTSVHHFRSYETTAKHAFLTFSFGFFRLCMRRWLNAQRRARKVNRWVFGLSLRRAR